MQWGCRLVRPGHRGQLSGAGHGEFGFAALTMDAAEEYEKTHLPAPAKSDRVVHELRQGERGAG